MNFEFLIYKTLNKVLNIIFFLLILIHPITSAFPFVTADAVVEADPQPDVVSLLVLLHLLLIDPNNADYAVKLAQPGFLPPFSGPEMSTLPYYDPYQAPDISFFVGSVAEGTSVSFVNAVAYPVLQLNTIIVLHGEHIKQTCGFENDRGNRLFY